ncbi:hypothetical protein [Niallia sp. NCCP-28]|nr:hypothetical protein [Niallia sp. NCCP-28]GKU82591.1 hypothetical protein NCCP28_19870 [Niallia sp. NCCP-28]
MQLIKKELKRLEHDYQQCHSLLIKKQIQIDIALLRNAISIYEQKNNS